MSMHQDLLRDSVLNRSMQLEDRDKLTKWSKMSKTEL